MREPNPPNLYYACVYGSVETVAPWQSAKHRIVDGCLAGPSPAARRLTPVFAYRDSGRRLEGFTLLNF